MTKHTPVHPELWKPLRYIGVYFLFVAVMVLFSWIMASLLNTRVPTGLASFLPPMIAAMVEGQRYAMDNGGPPPKGRLWRATLGMTGIVLIINLCFLTGFLILQTELIPMFKNYTPYLLAFGAFLLVLMWLVNRVFYGLGVRGYLKGKAAKEMP